MFQIVTCCCRFIHVFHEHVNGLCCGALYAVHKPYAVRVFLCKLYKLTHRCDTVCITEYNTYTVVKQWIVVVRAIICFFFINMGMGFYRDQGLRGEG